MGRGSAPQGGAGNYGGSRSAKPRKAKDRANTFKVKSAEAAEPEEATPESTPAFTVTRPSRERRAELLGAQRRDRAAAAELATRATALSHRPVNGTARGGEVLGGNPDLQVAPSAESLREARLQHLAKTQRTNPPAKASAQVKGKSSSSSSAPMVSESSPMLSSEAERFQALEGLLRQPIVESWQQERVADIAEDDSDGDIRDDELHVLASFLLDTLADRLGHADAMKGVRLLQTVLANVSKDDPKYRRLRAAKDKLWAGLLQHPEFCMVLEAAGFHRSTEEQDRCVELEQLQAEVHGLLASGEDEIDAGAVEALLQRMQELKDTPSSSVSCADIDSGPNSLAGRSATFVHPASEILLGDLDVVLEAVAEWSPLCAEDIAPVSADVLEPSKDDEEAEADLEEKVEAEVEAVAAGTGRGRGRGRGRSSSEAAGYC